MKTLVKYVMKAVVIENINDLVVIFCPPKKVMDLYGGVRHFLTFPCLTYDKRRHYEKISWKTYFNVLIKSKRKVFGEQ